MATAKKTLESATQKVARGQFVAVVRLYVDGNFVGEVTNDSTFPDAQQADASADILAALIVDGRWKYAPEPKKPPREPTLAETIRELMR